MQKIYVEVSAGLCNRMRSIMSGYNLAQKYDAELDVLWHLNRGLNCEFTQLFKPIGGGYKESRVPISLSFNMKKRNATVFNGINIADFEKVEHELSLGKNIYVDTPHQWYDVGSYEIFEPLYELENKAKAIIARDSNIIGIHIRRTDNVKSIENSPTELFIERIQESIVKDNSVKFYLATDSFEEERTLCREFGGRIITQGERDLARNSRQGIKDALVDLLCLSYCNKIWGSYWSSFSTVASLWNGEKELEILQKQQ